MPVLKPGLVVLVSLVLLLFACLTSPAEADLDRAPCLSPRVGEILSAQLAAHTFDGALPAGWVLEEVHVAPDHIDLGALDAERRPHGVALRRGGDAAGAVDGRGRSFAFVIDAEGAPLDDAGRKGLLDLAARVDAAVPEGEAQRICGTERRPIRPPSLQDMRRGPLWLRVGMAFFAIAIVGAVAAAWRCRQHLRSREAVIPAVLTVIALGVRLVAHAGAGDIRSVLEVGVGEGSPQRAGWSALLRLLFAVAPPRYETILVVHRVVGTLAVPLLYSALRQRFPQRSSAAASAAALAVVPLAARFSASDTPYVPLCTAVLGAIVALTHFRQSGSRGHAPPLRGHRLVRERPLPPTGGLPGVWPAGAALPARALLGGSPPHRLLPDRHPGAGALTAIPRLRSLDHGVDRTGYGLPEDDGRRMLPDLR